MAGQIYVGNGYRKCQKKLEILQKSIEIKFELELLEKKRNPWNIAIVNDSSTTKSLWKCFIVANGILPEASRYCGLSWNETKKKEDYRNLKITEQVRLTKSLEN